ncbi:SLAM family member 5-like isoform X2 [Mixophyes fleayi]|uniref:SLAM family member 5-like isoform X2 n=1 Tax=Mixophyes fleayi TaxID=3061075 RepID=UPI003F4E41AF
MLGLVAEVLSILLATNLLISEGKHDPPLQVTGIIDQSVDLSVGPTRPVYKVYWNFQTYIMASFINLHLDIISKQFNKRLEIVDNGTTLRIRDLRMEDSGIYSVTITSTDEEEYKTSYNITVYEPVPAPTIRIEGKNIISGWCNGSLHCSVPTNTSVLSYTWKYRDRDTEYQPYNNGTIIQMSLQNESWDMEFLCIVHNPADQKNVSVQAKDLCSESSKGRLDENMGKSRHHYGELSLLVIFLLVLLGWFLFRNKRRKKESTEDPPDEVHYADLTLSSQNLRTPVPKSRNAEKDFALKTSDGTVYNYGNIGEITMPLEAQSTGHSTTGLNRTQHRTQQHH